jgi:hypothetical protein
MTKDTEEQESEIQPTVCFDVTSPEAICAWWEGERSIDALHWWSLESITPEEAAKLLCCINPSAKIDPTSITTNSTSPRDYERLLRTLQDAARRESKDFSLQQWLEFARAHKLKYHPWIEEWRKAVAAINGGDESETVDVNPSRHMPKQQLQEKKILEWLRAKYGNPKHLPIPPQGKPGPKSAAWKALEGHKSVFPSKGTFDKAWDRLRASGEIQDEKKD